MPIYEPGLEEMVKRSVAEERLTFTTDLPTAVQASQIVFIAVGTPQGRMAPPTFSMCSRWPARSVRR